MTGIPQDPSLVWALMVAIVTLSGVVVYLNKQLEKAHLSKEKAMLAHKADVQHLLEKTLSGFNEIDRKIVDTDIINRSEIKDTIFIAEKNITNEMEKIVKRGN